MGSCVGSSASQKFISIEVDKLGSKETEQTLAISRYNSHVNRKILLDYYAAARNQMHRRIKQLFEIIFSDDNLEIIEINLNFTAIDVASIYHIKTVLQYFGNLQSLSL